MDDQRDLYILWTNADLLTSQLMVMMYATNSKKNDWWDTVTVIIWGATAKLAAENETIKEYIKIAQHTGVQFTACQACAEQLGTVKELEAQNIEVKYWGEPLTELLVNKRHLMTI